MEQTLERTFCGRCGTASDNHDWSGINHEFVTPTPIEEGDILTSSWGYDQTNIEYFLVIKRTKASVKLVRIGHRYNQAKSNATQDAVEPDTDNVMSEPFTRRIKDGGRGSEGCNDWYGHGWARKWYGETRYQTNPLFGH